MDRFFIKNYGGRILIEDEDGNQLIGISPIVQSGRKMTPYIKEYMTRAERALVQLVEVMNEGDAIQRKQCAPEYTGIHVNTCADTHEREEY